MEPYLDPAQFAWLTQVVLSTQNERDTSGKRLAAYARSLRFRRAGRQKESNEELNRATAAGPDLDGVPLSLSPRTAPSGVEQVVIALLVKRADIFQSLTARQGQQQGFSESRNTQVSASYSGSIAGRAVRLVTVLIQGEPGGRAATWASHFGQARADLAIALDFGPPATQTAPGDEQGQRPGLATLYLFDSVQRARDVSVGVQPRQRIFSSWRVLHRAREFFQSQFDLASVAAQFQDVGSRQIEARLGSEGQPDGQFAFDDHAEIRMETQEYLALRWESPDTDSSTGVRRLVHMSVELVEYLVAHLSTWLRPATNTSVRVSYLPAATSDTESDKFESIVEHFRQPTATPLLLHGPSARQNGLLALQYAHRQDLTAQHRIWLRWRDPDERAYDVAAVLQEVGQPDWYYEGTNWQEFVNWLASAEPALVIVDDVQDTGEELRSLVDSAPQGHQILVVSREPLPLENLEQLTLSDASTISPPQPKNAPVVPGRASGPLYKRYAREVATKLDAFATWLPNSPVEAGDVGIWRGGQFSRVSSLADLGIFATTVQYSEIANVQFTADAKVKFAEREISIEFGTHGGIVFAGRQVSSTRLQDLPGVERRVIEAYTAGRWAHHWNIIDKVYHFGWLTVVISASSYSQVTLEIQSPAALSVKSWNDLTGPDTRLELRSVRDTALCMIGQRDCTPLFTLVRLKRPVLGLFGNAGIEAVTPRGRV
jgi:hypothetical protein